MAHNAYIRPLGVWAALSDLLNTEMEAFDLRQFQAVNGDLGGTWTPAAAIIIGGTAGLNVTGPFVASDASVTIGHGRTLTILGTAGGAAATMNANLGSAINLLNGSATTLAGLLHVTPAGAVVADSGSVTTLNGSVVLGTTGTLLAEGFSTIQVNSLLTVVGGGTLTCNDNSVVGLNGDTTFGSTAIVVGHASSVMTLNGAVTLNGVTSLDGTPTVVSGTTLAFAAGSALSANATAPFTLANVVTCTNQVLIQSPCTLLIEAGATFTTQAGATITRGAEETRTSRVTLSGSGAYTRLRYDLGSTADHTYLTTDVVGFDVLEVPIIPSDVTWKFQDPPSPSDTFRFHINGYAFAITHTLTIADGGGGTLATFVPGLGSMDMYWNGSRYVPSARTGTVT